MITKRIILGIIFLLMVKAVSCQVIDTIKVTPIYDDDSTHFATIYSTNGKVDSTTYYDINKNRINVLFKSPKFKYGNDSLKSFLINQFRERVNYDEVHGAAIVYVLLVNNKIKEIRIGKRMGYNCKYDPIIKQCLMKTQGKWIVSKEDHNKRVLFIYLFEMK
jgi:hypothetical protein